MATLQALYQQNPFWIWIALGCLFVGLTLATGRSRLMAPAVACAATAIPGLLGLRFGIWIEAAIFVVLCVATLAVAYVLTPPAAAPEPPAGDVHVAGSASRREAQTARLAGRIGRTTSEFVNGVGRVWIDGAEWGAELDGGDSNLAEGSPVRVVKVIGGIRLQVHALSAG